MFIDLIKEFSNNMTDKIIYFPMCFNGTDWQTEQALKEKKLICGLANL